jgi:hypothetical protein
MKHVKRKLNLTTDTIRTLTGDQLKGLRTGVVIDGSWRDWTCDVCGPSMPSVCPL